MIPNFTSSKVANELSEPIMGALYKVTIIPHPSLQLADIDLLQEEIKSVSGLDKFEVIPDTVAQQFGPGQQRLFPGLVVDNVVECNIVANVNLRGDDGTNATNLLTLKKMKDLQFNRATGQRGMKKNCIFTVIVTRFNKDGSIWYVATLENCLFGPNGVSGLDEVNIDNQDAAVLNFTVKSDKNSAEYADTI